jgi:hypothetical protein
MNKKINFMRKTLVISAALIMISSIFVLPSAADGVTYDYVIITTNDIEANSQELPFFIKMKENDGHSVKVVTEDEFNGLTGQYPNDRADKIRQWLKNNYATMGIDYVLLIGDPDPDSFKEGGDYVGDIPMKMCYPRYFRIGDGAPTDLYYSDLTSDWDLDNDGYYHESLDYYNPTSPDPSIHEDTFSVQWSGEVQCDFNEEYTFKILSDDGVQLFIDNTLVINNWMEHDLTYNEWTSEMTVGKHNISINFRENYGDGVVKLYWRTEVPDTDPCYIKNTLIPSTHLYDNGGVVGGLSGNYFNNPDFTDITLSRKDPQIDFIWGTGDMGNFNPDYTPEVFVGRIPVYDNDYAQLDEILRKIIDYETDPEPIGWRETILLPMVRMNDITTSAGLGEVIKSQIATPNGFTSYRIYEPDSGFSPELTPPTITNVKNEWKNGYGMVTWHTHGGQDGASHVMDTASLGVLDDSKPAFTFQGSCHNAYPENPDNLAYSLLKHGAVATVAGTRMTTFQYGDYTLPGFNPIEYMNHQMAYYYTKYIIDSGMSAGAAYAEVVKQHKAPNSNAIEFNLYGDPECYLLSVDPNAFPVADANGPYTGDEGSPITFDASGSSDPGGETLKYRWDFDGDSVWDTDWLASPTSTYTWGDDYSGTVYVQARDEIGKTDISSTTVTVDNVAPTTTFDTLGQPNPQFILPYQELTFEGDFSDDGWLDTHTATWDWGDASSAEPGVVTEENDEPDSTGTTTAVHAYSAPGTYTVTLTITDDEGAIDTDTMVIEVVTALEALEDLDDYIQNVPDDDYKDKATNRKKAFTNKFKAIYKILEDEDYQKLIDKLNLDLRIKADGLIDGDPIDDWIIEYNAQYHICMKIDDITAYLATFP